MELDQLREFVEADAETKFENGVIRDVIILGNASKNKGKFGGGRKYTPNALRQAVPLYEGMAVYEDHPTKIDHERGGRAARDRFGIIRTPHFVESVKGPQIRGDLVHLTTHPLAPRVGEDLERHLNFFGLSHLADGKSKNQEGVQVVEQITTVREVDLVTNAATADGLREQEEMAATPPQKTEEELKAEEADRHADMALQDGVMAILKDPATSKEEKMKKIQALFTAHLEIHEEEEEEEEEEAEEKPAAEQTDTLTKAVGELTEQVKTLTEQHKVTTAELAAIKKRKYLPPATGISETATATTLAEQHQTIPIDKEAKEAFFYARD